VRLRRGRSSPHDIRQHVHHLVGHVFVQGAPGDDLVLLDGTALGVFDLADAEGLGAHAAIGEDGERGGHLEGGDLAGPDREREVRVHMVVDAHPLGGVYHRSDADSICDLHGTDVV
jgi:hypothetical protein